MEGTSCVESCLWKKIHAGAVMVASLVLMLLGSGFIFGWAPLLGILQSEGFYADLCPDSVGPCDAQMLKLNAIFTVATFGLLASALPAGILLDKFGPRKLAAMSSVVVVLGSVMMGMSSEKVPLFIPGYTLMGIGGNSVGLSLFTISSLYKKYQSGVVGAFTAFWNASPIVMLFFSLLYSAGVAYRTLWLGYLVVPVCIFIYSFFWPKEHEHDAHKKLQEESVLEGPQAVRESEKMSDSADYQADAMLVVNSSVEEKVPGVGDGTFCPDYAGSPGEQGAKQGKTSTPSNLHSASLKKQLCSLQFMLAAAYLALQALFVNTFIGTLSIQAADSPGANVDTIIQLFGVIFPVGQLVSAIIVVPTLASKHWLGGTVGGYIATSIAGVILASACFFEVISKWAFCASFIAFSLWRSFLYCTTWAYDIEVFGYEHYGVISGVMNTLSGIVSCAQYGLVAIAVSKPHGMLVFDTLQASILVLLAGLPLLLFRLTKRHPNKDGILL